MERMEVGTGQHCIFIADRIGIATVSEQRPYPDKSLIIAIFSDGIQPYMPPAHSPEHAYTGPDFYWSVSVWKLRSAHFENLFQMKGAQGTAQPQLRANIPHAVQIRSNDNILADCYE